MRPEGDVPTWRSRLELRIERLAFPKPELIDERFTATDPASTLTVDHSPWSLFLTRYLKADRHGVHRLGYGDVDATDRRHLQDYIEGLERTDLAGLERKEQLAFWINLYNAKTVDVVLDAYPVRSIREIRLGGRFAIGPWDEPLVRVLKRDLSLNDIEHRIVRPLFRDARVHYALNCAAVGCPNLAACAFRGETLDAALDAGGREYVKHPRGAGIEGRGRLVVSKIYGWFREDFGDVLSHLRSFAEPEKAKRIAVKRRIDGYRYDWSLNDQSTA